MFFVIRLSRESDKEEVNLLMECCFGDRTERDFLKNIETGRYLVYELDERIVAMTGLSSDTIHDGLEID